MRVCFQQIRRMREEHKDDNTACASKYLNNKIFDARGRTIITITIHNVCVCVRIIH
jgi:hypothetical protein